MKNIKNLGIYNRNMKNKIIVLIILLFCTVMQAEEITINVGETKEVNGYDVLLKNIKTDKVVVSINEESKIIDLNEQEELLGLKIKVNEITYFSDSEGYAKLDITSLYVCGDGNCDDLETADTCCQDCECSAGYDCEDSICIVHVDNECNTDTECEDNNENTLDRCTGSPKKCQNISTLICTTDQDCEDDNECTEDKCTNNDCFNTQIEGCVKEETPEQETESESEESSQQESEEEREEENSENSPGVIASEKEGFFSRIFGWLKRLFS
mgnify:CR=1 FL=1